MLACDAATEPQTPAAPASKPEAQEASLTACFDTREIKTTVEPGVAVVDLCYEFTNNGELPLIVEEFQTSCGCMLGESNEVQVKPGEKGRITAKFLTKGLRGKVRKSLRVKFLEVGTVELTGEVTIPETLTYSAQTLRWGIGAACTPREVEVTVHSKKPVRVLSVECGDGAFSSELATLEEGRRYRVTITPGDTATECVGIFQVRTDATDPRDALQSLFGIIEQPAMKGTPP